MTPQARVTAGVQQEEAGGAQPGLAGGAPGYAFMTTPGATAALRYGSGLEVHSYILHLGRGSRDLKPREVEVGGQRRGGQGLG